MIHTTLFPLTHNQLFSVDWPRAKLESLMKSMDGGQGRVVIRRQLPVVQLICCS